MCGDELDPYGRVVSPPARKLAWRPETVARIESAIGSEQFAKLRSADMPAWMAAVLNVSAPNDAAHG